MLTPQGCPRVNGPLPTTYPVLAVDRLLAGVRLLSEAPSA
jgi:hypothetical protein